MRTQRHGSRSRAAVRVAASAAGAAALVFAADARAQLGAANVPLPNVLILLDTSGSFEKMIDGANPEDANNQAGQPQNPDAQGNYARCLAGSTPLPPGGPTAQSVPNRWGVAVQALTGTMQPYFTCFAMDRTQPQFIGEYGIQDVSGQHASYDAGYYLPFHRPLAPNTGTSPATFCAFTPGALPGSLAGGVGLAPPL